MPSTSHYHTKLREWILRMQQDRRAAVARCQCHLLLRAHPHRCGPFLSSPSGPIPHRWTLGFLAAAVTGASSAVEAGVHVSLAVLVGLAVLADATAAVNVAGLVAVVAQWIAVWGGEWESPLHPMST
jgi:hypothetical protein